MKAKLLIAVLMLVGIAPAQANDEGAWVKVDASGNAIGGAIVCTPDVCGDLNSEYSKATLQAGERYVLQSKADPITNNVAGVGNNNPGVAVRVDISTNTWTFSKTEVLESPAHPATNETVKVVLKTSEIFNPITQPDPVSQKEILVERKIDLVAPDINWQTYWEKWLSEWDFFNNWLVGLYEGWTL